MKQKISFAFADLIILRNVLSHFWMYPNIYIYMNYANIYSIY